MEITETRLVSGGLAVCGASFYTIFQLVQSKRCKTKHDPINLFVDFFSALFTGVLCGLGAVGLSPETGVSLALYGAGALLGPKGFDKLLSAVAKK